MIAHIPEASGICYLKDSKKLIVVNDEGYIYTLSKKGKILSKKYIGAYDFEGIAEYKDYLFIAVEDKNSIFILEKETFAIINKIKFKKSKKIKQSKKHGLEAITVISNTIYISYQKAGLFKLKNMKSKKPKLKKMNTHHDKDISGLSYHKNFLYILSDKNNLLIKYDIYKNKTIKKIKLPKASQEGICFDEKNNFYIADDDGRILKYKMKKFSL